MRRDAWLRPNGEIIEVDQFKHDEYARDFLTKEMEMEGIKRNITSPTMELHKRGWVRIKYNIQWLPRIEIMGGNISMIKPMRNTIDPAMNEKQLKVARRLCEEMNTSLHVAINHKSFW